MLRPRPNILAPINPVNAPIPRGCFIVIGQLFAVIDQDVTFLPATGCAFNITFQILTGSGTASGDTGLRLRGGNGRRGERLEA